MSQPLDALAEVRRRERQRIYAAIHDEIGGTLTAAGLEIGMLEMDVPPSLIPQVRKIQAVLELTFAQVRELSRSVRPEPDLATLSGRFESHIEPSSLPHALIHTTAEIVLDNFEGPCKLDLSGSTLLIQAPNVLAWDPRQHVILELMQFNARAAGLQFAFRLEPELGTIIELYR